MDENPACIITDPVPDHPLLKGRKEIGRGESTIVLEADTVDGQERVYKILSSPTDYAYYTAEDRPTGRHFPVVFADHGTVGRSSRGFPFHIVEVEKLYPLPVAGEAAEVATKISSSYFDACMIWRNLTFPLLHQPRLFSRSFTTCMRKLNSKRCWSNAFYLIE